MEVVTEDDSLFDFKRAETMSHKGFSVPDPFAPRRKPGASFLSAILATALFRCWHILIFFSAWGALITILNEQGHTLSIQSTLLTVLGTVLGFVISYRTTSSFERYNEGRRLWSQIILASRTFARTTWFHIPDPTDPKGMSLDEAKARCMVEKKTVINLLEAFGVAVKHYLRGEDGIYYKDLYFLVKFLPAYALPTGIPSTADLTQFESPPNSPVRPRVSMSSHQQQQLPFPATSKPANVGLSKKTSFVEPSSPRLRKSSHTGVSQRDKTILAESDEQFLMPASMPPKYALFDLFPFSLLVKALTKQGRELKGKKAARLRAKMTNKATSHNLPLEITFYLSSYISALQVRKAVDVPTINTLLLGLNQLTEALTGLERILTTPIPFSYSIHLWLVTSIYCLALPFQIYSTLKWVTIPATSIVSFIFFGFLVAGEEIENPFGYDKNDLNMDHFTYNIIRNELRAITSTSTPDPAKWAFAPENNTAFAVDPQHNSNLERVGPEEWVKRGVPAMQAAMAIAP